MSEKDFDKGYKSGFQFGNEVANEEWTNKVKQAREDIWKKVQEYSGSGNEVTQAYCNGFKDSLAILDKLIESDEVNADKTNI